MFDAGLLNLKEFQIQASSVAVDSSGSFAVLGSRRFVVLLQFEADSSCILHKKISRNGKWDVGASAWSQCQESHNNFALTSNEKVELYTWGQDSLKCLSTISAHSRLISDIDWSAFQPNLFLTSSVDEYIHGWDIRSWKKPVYTFSIAAGASQVKLCRAHDNIVASSIEGDIKIWDLRKLTSPMHSIAAHLGKVHGLDWSHQTESLLASSSQDCTVKIWDYRRPSHPQMTVATQTTPIWRGKFTPLGRGLVTTAVPQVKRGENSLILWSLMSPNTPTPLQSFLGHTDVVLDFRWRLCVESRCWQLLSLSKDQTIRMWPMSDQIHQFCSYEVSPAVNSRPVSLVRQISRKLTHDGGLPETELASSASSSLKNESTFNLQREFAIVGNLNIQNVSIEEINAKERSIRTTCRVRNHTVKLTIVCAVEWKKAESLPVAFQFSADTTISQAAKAAILRQLNEICSQPQSATGSCLESCLRNLPKLVSQYASVTTGSKVQIDSENPERPISFPGSFHPSHTNMATYQDALVPFPRTSGAKFSSVGILVCFGRLISSTSELMGSTPRALSALNPVVVGTGTYGSQIPTRPPDYSVSAFFEGKRSKKKSASKFSDVLIYEISDLLPVNRTLGKNYTISNKDVSNVCLKNAQAAIEVDRKDLVQMWTTLSLVTDESLRPKLNPDIETPWPVTPCGRKLVESYLTHFCKIGDIQTAAMICCVLSDPRGTASQQKVRPKFQADYLAALPSDLGGGINQRNRKKRNSSLFGATSPYNTYHATDFPSNIKSYVRQRSNSLDEHQQDMFTPPNSWNFPTVVTADLHPKNVPSEQDIHDDNCKFLNPLLERRFEGVKKSYAEILYRWGLLNQRTLVMKFCSPVAGSSTVDFCCLCQTCGTESSTAQCHSCKQTVLKCIICEMSVRGLATVCPMCGHGGHIAHMASWFKEFDRCPAGCSCNCAKPFSQVQPVFF